MTRDEWTPGEPRLHLAHWGGDGAPILLAHGLAANTHWWDAAAPLLAKEYRVSGFDFEGHGESGWRAGGDYGPDIFCRDIESVRAHLGLDNMILGAHSMGARAAIDYAAAHPRRVRALVLVDFLADSYETKAFRFEVLKKRPQPVYPDAGPMRRRFRLEPPGTLLSPEELEALAGASLKPVEGGFTWKFHWRAFSCRYEAVWPLLPKIAVPTVVIRGEHSTVMDAEDYSRVLAAIPGSQGVIIPEAHHHVPLDRPQELARAFIDRVRAILG